MKGSCLCGAIEVTTADQSSIDICHCTTCRRWGGGPLFAVHCGPDVTFGGRQKPAVYRSSNWAERGFCATCGTHLFYHLLPTADYMLSAGIFADETAFCLNTQVFFDEKPAFYSFANETPTMDGDTLIAQFSDTQKDGPATRG